MPKITGRVYDIGLGGSKGTMWLSAGFRTGTDGVVAPRRVSYPIVDGNLPDNVIVEPGPAYLEIDVGVNARDDWPVIIPETDISLRDLIADAFPWSPVELTAFAQLRIAAEQAATAAGQSATAAAGSETAAGESETNAKLSEDNAATSESNAANSQSAAAQSETNAASSESNAYGSEQAAAASEGKALQYRDTAGDYKDVTVVAGADAAQSAGAASGHAAAAGQARTQAEQHAAEASQSRIVWRGDWDAGTSYATRDAVHHTGSTWRALRPNTGIPPVEGADWALMAERGLSYGSQIKIDTDGTPYLDVDPDYSEVPAAVNDRVTDAETAADTAGSEANRARDEADRAGAYAAAQDTAIAELVDTPTATQAALDARYLAGGVRPSGIYDGLFEIGPNLAEDALLDGLYLIP